MTPQPRRPGRLFRLPRSHDPDTLQDQASGARRVRNARRRPERLRERQRRQERGSDRGQEGVRAEVQLLPRARPRAGQGRPGARPRRGVPPLPDRAASAATRSMASSSTRSAIRRRFRRTARPTCRRSSSRASSRRTSRHTSPPSYPARARTPASSRPRSRRPAPASRWQRRAASSRCPPIPTASSPTSPRSPPRRRGALEIDSKNDASIPHDIAVEGNGVNEKGETVQGGGISKVSATFKPGKYAVLLHGRRPPRGRHGRHAHRQVAGWWWPVCRAGSWAPMSLPGCHGCLRLNGISEGGGTRRAGVPVWSTTGRAASMRGGFGAHTAS